MTPATVPQVDVLLRAARHKIPDTVRGSAEWAAIWAVIDQLLDLRLEITGGQE